MRPFLLFLCLLAAAAANAAANPPAPSSAANLVRLHPGPWRLPARAALAGIRFEPESGETSKELSGGAFSADDAALRARAEASVRLMPDGSRHAVLGGALRRWTVATIDDQGRLVQDCVHSEAEARRIIEAAAAQQVRK
jgi:hypothetical protein